MKEKIINYASILSGFERLMAEPGRLNKEVAKKCLQKKEEMLDMMRQISSDDNFRELLSDCPDQASYELLASAMGDVIGPARVLEIEAGAC
ncbi:MAG: hypothetical protein WC919_05305 [Candidatus Paceibacterota bacterium]